MAEAHLIVRAFNPLVRITAPALLFKSAAIVHPNEVAAYIRPEECRLSYNPLLMALLSEALATRQDAEAWQLASSVINLVMLALARRHRVDLRRWRRVSFGKQRT